MTVTKQRAREIFNSVRSLTGRFKIDLSSVLNIDYSQMSNGIDHTYNKVWNLDTFDIALMKCYLN